MNTYAKYCPNVWLAKCTDAHQRGDVIEVETRYGKVNESIVFNLIAEKDGYYYYSIVRADGFNVQEWAKRRADRLNSAAGNAEKKSTGYWNASQEGADFLRLAEPIKVGHHSEKRHRSLIERNRNRMDKCVEYSDKAETYAQLAEYWEEKANTINLSMPESIEYFEFKLEQATRRHEELKADASKRDHSYSLTYAKKEVNEARKNLEIANKLWA